VGVLAAHDPFFAWIIFFTDGKTDAVTGGDARFTKEQSGGCGKIFTVSGSGGFEKSAYRSLSGVSA
jgi:hypothetical protein